MPANPIQQIEEAIILLRRQDARAWVEYLLSAVPFLLTLLAFVHDMTAGYLAERCALESLACAFVYFWSCAWKARFGAALLATMNGPGSAPRAGFWNVFYLQSILQSMKLMAFPFAAVSVLPLPWTSAFFRNAAIEAAMSGATLRRVIAKSAQRASFNMRGNWLGVLILCLLFFLVFVNIYVVLAGLPFLVRTLTGSESLTRHSGGVFSFHVFCVVLALAWLVIDPLVLAYCVVRCFYSEARTDGRDLLARLQQVAALALLALLLAPHSTIKAAETAPYAVSQQKLSAALRHAAESDGYAWLRTRNEQQRGPGAAFFNRFSHDLAAAGKVVESWFSNLGKWLRELLERSPLHSSSKSSLAASKSDVHWLLYLVGALVLLAAIIAVVRLFAKAPEPVTSDVGQTETHDLRADHILASDLPEEEWLRLARDLLAQGEQRLAVRAMYLSNLSHLGAQHLIKVARAKSNSIYERELRLRPQGSPAAAPFAHSNRNFERVWYGFDEVTPEFVAVFEQDVEEIRRHAKT